MPRPLEFTQISSDAFKSWSRCKRQFFYKYVKKMQWPADIQHFRLGKDVHKLMDYQARGLDCALLLDNAPMDVSVSWQKLLNHPTAHLPVLANEWAFHVPITALDGYTDWLTGRIDRVARKEGEVWVIDWKTGTGVPRNPEMDWQTRLYLYALVEVAQTQSAEDLGLNWSGPLQPEQVKFVYVEVKADNHTPVREVTLAYNANKHEATRQTLQAIVSAMAVEEDYALPDNRQCPDKYCAYRTICGIDV
jgi:CRISPR/Cas system-associated exonuclease Cas4 (RecB family)